MPYKTVKPFMYQGVPFQPGELFLPELFKIDQRRLSMLIKNRHLSTLSDATAEEVQEARARIKKTMAALKKGMSSTIPAAMPNPVEEEAPAETGPEKEEETEEVVDAANPEREGTNVVPAREVPSVDVDAEEEDSAEEGEPSKPAPVTKSKRRS